jgi:xanthosine utilization system XapX-like protein
LFISFDNDVLLKQMLFLFSFVAFVLIGIIKGFFTKKYFKSMSEVVIIGSIGIYISFQISRFVKSQL